MRRFTIQLSSSDVAGFALASGDVNPLHLDDEYARNTPYGACIAYGVLGGLVALGHLAERAGSALSRLEMRFLGPFFIGRPYELVVKEPSPEAALLTVLDGQQQTLTVEARFEASPIEREIRNAAAVTARAVPADLVEGAIREGQVLEGDYAPHYAALSSLLERLHVTRVDRLQAAVLTWASYFIGMELPGRRALFSGLEIDFDARLEGGDGALRYRAEVESVKPRFGLVRVRGRVESRTGPVARVALSAFVRSEAPATSAKLLARFLPPSQALAGKVALVIGGSRGLGAALVVALASQGCTV